jgi:hypothetical protein
MSPEQEQAFRDWQEADKPYRFSTGREEQNDRIWFERGYNQSLDRITALEQEVERLKLLCEPRPIETAPRGEDILLWCVASRLRL